MRDWKLIGLWRITQCLARGSLEWWNDPRSRSTILRATKSGSLYDFRHTQVGYLIRRRETDFQTS